MKYDKLAATSPSEKPCMTPPEVLLNSIVLFEKTARMVNELGRLNDAKSDAELAGLMSSLTRKIVSAGCGSLSEYIDENLKTDDNVFSRAAARGESIPQSLKNIAVHDIRILRALSEVDASRAARYNAVANDTLEWKTGAMRMTYSSLRDFYKDNGCGVYSASNVFVCDPKNAKGSLIKPLSRLNVRLADLKGYDDEKREVYNNTKNFVEGKPAFNALLYGDRGTGKSTTVRALAGEFDGKLKVVQLFKSDILRLSDLMEELSATGLKWIVFLDDLVFDDSNDEFNTLKATLEGSLSYSPDVLVYATTNRRHLVKESDAPHRGDEAQEQMALFDRFGLVVTYIAPNKDEFISILRAVLEARGIKWKAEYEHIAELSALRRGGRSPRAAKQIADVIACEIEEARNA